MTTSTIDTVDTFRPDNLGTFVGQPEAKRTIVAHVDACFEQGRPLPHTLLLGVPGSGKTTLARIIADMLGARLEVFASPPTPSSFIERLLEFGDGVVLIDEIHEWSRGLTDRLLLTLLEEGYIDSPAYGRIEFPRLTIIAATTEREKVSKPLRSRFTLQPKFEPYTDDEVAVIAAQMAVRAGVTLEWEQAVAFGRAAGGIPRQARILVQHARALQASRGSWTVDDVFTMANVEADGLTGDHIAYMEALRKQAGDVGLSTLSTRLRLAEAEVRDVERLLLDRNLITLARTGRRLMPAGRKRLDDGPADA